MEPSNPENKNNQHQEHETHTTALVFLVIASLIIAYIALTYSGDISGTPGEDDQTPATTSESSQLTEAEKIAIGASVPQSKVDSTESNDLSSLPSDLYIEEENITENKKLDTGNHIIRFSTERSLSDLYDEYRSWTEGSQYEVVYEVNNEDGIKVVGSSDAGQITLSANLDGESNQVSISHVLFE